MQRKNGYLLLITLLSLTLFVGTQVFERLFATGDSIYQNVQILNQVINIVAERYVDRIDSSELYIRSIRGLLSTLDPHSQFLTPEEYKEFMIETTDRDYQGIGIQIADRNKWITVIAPIEGTPAYNAGIQAGDRIIEIDGEATDGWTSKDAASKIRGRKNTNVSITVGREGVDNPIKFDVTRDVIEMKSVPYSYMLTPEIGYARLSVFSKQSHDELDEAIHNLEVQGMTGLILDLRSNPGGLLDQAVQVSDMFLNKGELIVFTKGRSADQTRHYYAQMPAIHGAYPMIVLIDGGSASASEIVAGALQDHDRALVLGTTSFGKGSVQTPLPLSGGGILKLTTAYYYTPSGRNIHKKEIDDIFMQVTRADVDSIQEKNDVYMTDSGRKVYGGGGITPDVITKAEELTEVKKLLLAKPFFFDFAIQFKARHTSLSKDVQITEDIVHDFREFLAQKNVDITDTQFAQEKQYIKTKLKAEIYKIYWGLGEAFKSVSGNDVQLQQSIRLLSDGKTLKEIFELAQVK